MPTWHLRSQRKPTGKLLKPLRKKRRMDRGGIFLAPSVGEIKKRIDRVRGGNRKVRLLAVNLANVSDEKGKTKKVKILGVVQNTANPHLSLIHI